MTDELQEATPLPLALRIMLGAIVLGLLLVVLKMAVL